MSERRPIDDLRDWARGRLDGPARARFEERLRGERELSETAEQWGLAASLPDDPAPSSSLRFEQLELRRGPRIPPAASIAAAAALLLAATLLLLSREGGRGAVRLSAIPPRALPAEPRPALPPEALARYEGFLEGMSQSRAFSEFSSRPALFVFAVPGCPICAELFDRTFPSPAAREVLDSFVCFRVPYDGRSVGELLRGEERLSWPILVARDFEADRTDVIDGVWRAEPLLRELRLSAQSLRGDRPAPPPWPLVRRLAGSLLRAAASTPAAAFPLLTDVERSDPAGPFGASARAALRAMGAEARSALDAARGLPLSDAGAALRAARDRFQGTPYEPDFALLLDRVTRDGRFPPLEEPR